MRGIEVIGIGDELLAGHTVNSNAARLSRELGKIGLRVTGHRVLADKRGAIKEGLREAMGRNSLVICTGGLGPTFDDNTRKAVAELLGCGFRYDKGVAARLEERFQGPVPGLKDQATIPEIAKPFHNAVGTAPGLLFELSEGVLILLPGVPVEMESLLERDVLPYLEKRFVAEREVLETVCLYQVKEVEVDAVLRELGPRYPDVKLGIYRSLGVVSVRLSHPKDMQALLPLKQELEKRFSGHLFSSPDGTLEGAIHERFIERGFTLSTAESCTGGAIASRLIARAGASDYFLGSIVSYSDEVKREVLGVSPKTLEEAGAVSEQTVREMVEGLLSKVNSDYGVAVSGIAGPTGGTPEKPVGTVWIVVAKRGDPPITSLIHAKGNRAAVITRTVHHALSELLKLM